MNNEEKYIDLLLNKCLLKKSNTLFIYYDVHNKNFINKLIAKAKEKYEKIVYDEEDYELEHKILKELTYNEIKNHEYYLKKIDIWNTASTNHYDMLMVQTVLPNYFDDLSEEKRLLKIDLKNKALEKYLEVIGNDSVSWTIFTLPNEIWANKLFPKEENKIQLLEQLIYRFSLIDRKNPKQEWDKYIKIEQKKCEYLNNLNIKKMIFKNKLGTNITLGIVDNYIFRSLENNHSVENIPTYSIWTTPNKYIADGIVYMSIPLVHNFIEIKDAWFKFKNGKVIEYDAKKGKWFLDEFFAKGDEYKRLGEIALIDYSSPISNTNKIYNCVLFDENISTHFAFGNAYQNTIKNGTKMTKEQLDEIGCNICSNHLDFNVGTNDFNITVITNDEKRIEIFKNGNFNYKLIKENSPFLEDE